MILLLSKENEVSKEEARRKIKAEICLSTRVSEEVIEDLINEMERNCPNGTYYEVKNSFSPGRLEV